MSQHPALVAAPRVATPGDAGAISELLVDAFANDLMSGSWVGVPRPCGLWAAAARSLPHFIAGALRYPWVWLTDDARAAL